MLRVIDTSNWKNDINLSAINEQFDAVYTRATLGNGYVDPSCDPIIQQAIALGKPWGVYHFAKNHFSGAIEQANFFVDNCIGYINKGMLILDYEREDNNVTDVAWALTWLRQVEARTGVKALIYMSESVLNEADWSPVSNENYGLIVANYWWWGNIITNFGKPAFPNPQVTWVAPNGENVQNVMWQFTSEGRLDGYGGNLDCNYFYGDANTWALYARAAVAPAPTVEQTTPAPSPEPMPVVEPVPYPDATSGSTETPDTTTDTTSTPTPDTTPVVVPKPVPVPKPITKRDVMLRIFHTFWQSFLAVFTLSISGLYTSLLNIHSISDAKALGVSLVTALGAAAFAAVKNTLKYYKEHKVL